MADKHISALPAVEELADDSLLVVEQYGEAHKLSGRQLKDFAQLMDINSGETVRVWFGTVAEYNALTHIYPDVYYNILE